jgi:hypothetical protein
MSVIIHQPEIEALIEQRMATGAFADVEAVLLHALESAPIPTSAQPEFPEKLSLVEVCAMVQGLTEDLDLTRDPSPGRPVSFA